MSAPRTILLLLTAASAGCDGQPLSGPPPLRLGRDECGECGMLINEDRCSSGMLVEERGRRRYILFDDIGCMLDAEREHAAHPGGQSTILERYVHDRDTRSWVEARAAIFLFADPQALPTPMGTGMVAYATSAAAEQARHQYGGTVLDYAALAEARRRWMEERYGRPESPK